MQAICVTGSKHDAYAKDEWNLKLQELLCTAFDRQQRILGICFGCQTMAIVLGGRVGESLQVLSASRMHNTMHNLSECCPCQSIVSRCSASEPIHLWRSAKAEDCSMAREGISVQQLLYQPQTEWLPCCSQVKHWL